MIHKLFWPVLLVAALLFAACGSPSAPASTAPTPAPAAAQPTAAVEEEAEEEAAEEEAEPTPAPEQEPATSSENAETLDVSDLGESLDALKSYRMRFTFSFEGKNQEGKPEKGSIEFVQEVIKGSNDQHMRMTASGDAAEGGEPGSGSFEFFQVGGSSYIYSPEGEGDQKCLGFSSDDASAQPTPFKPGDFVGGVEDAQLVKRGEEVNGIMTDHYTFDQSGLSFATFASASGDLWVAQDGGYLVRYTGKASGKNTIMGEESEGDFSWDYAIEEVNQIEAIALPKECEGQKPADDIPVPTSATEKASFGGIITFKSKDSIADLVAFYKKELPAQGWTAGEASSLGEMETLNFTKEGRALSVTIMKDSESGGSTVMISETKGS